MDSTADQELTTQLAEKLFHSFNSSQTIDIKKLAASLDVKRLALQQALNWLLEAGMILEPAGPERWRLQQPSQPVSQLQQKNLLSGIPIHYLFSCGSTNLQVRDNSILIADHQSQGQGRSGRSWITPPGQSICFSYCRTLPQPPQTLSQLSIVAAVSVLQTLQKFDPDTQLRLKWPNDLYRDQRKAGGILLQLEPVAASTDLHRLVIGIGLNWHVAEPLLASIDQPCNNLIDDSSDISRATFLVSLLEQLHHNTERMLDTGLKPFINLWHQYDYLQGQQVRLRHGLRALDGRYLGLNSDGLLMLQQDGETITFASGEVSVRPL